MATIQKYITINKFADFHQVKTTLLWEFADFGLIEITQVEDQPCIGYKDLDKCERAVRLYRELGVNKEGIEIILNMRDQIAEMQKELARLRHKLAKHESRLERMFLEEGY